MDRTPDFLTQAHDERDPSPWLALYLDQSTPLPDNVKAAWLADAVAKLDKKNSAKKAKPAVKIKLKS